MLLLLSDGSLVVCKTRLSWLVLPERGNSTEGVSLSVARSRRITGGVTGQVTGFVRLRVLRVGVTFASRRCLFVEVPAEPVAPCVVVLLCVGPACLRAEAGGTVPGATGPTERPRDMDTNGPPRP